ncbi:TetR/AcrR family transcriptional regulator [Psychrosphaera aestuarii]|uniref:TetR/AcrR family transcriptional regulator n=1 Tax=Psychrosphaera aestuarii TaxID=1266052 RepID=UPI001B318C61|nr:TetR/AcrR family transcriptional regulator [Psychrosphaera aestuarii]
MSVLKARSDAQKLAKKQAIIDAANQLYSQGDLPSIQQIANQAGVAKGTVYLYFSSKEGIFLNIYEQLWIDCVNSFERVEKPERSFKGSEKSTCHLLPVVNYWLENPRFSRLLAMKDALLMPSLSKQELAEFNQNCRDVLLKKARQISLINVDSVRINEYADLIDLTIKLIQLVWLQDSMYDTQLPDKQSFCRNVEQVVAPHWNCFQDKNEANKPRRKGWRSLLGTSKS